MSHSGIRWESLAVRQDRSGKRWNFSYWHTVLSPLKAQRLFFWDDEFKQSGVVLFQGGATRPYGQIRNLVDELVADQELRTKHHRELRFPLKRHYAEFGAFPEELQESSM